MLEELNEAMRTSVNDGGFTPDMDLNEWASRHRDIDANINAIWNELKWNTPVLPAGIDMTNDMADEALGTLDNTTDEHTRRAIMRMVYTIGVWIGIKAQSGHHTATIGIDEQTRKFTGIMWTSPEDVDEFCDLEGLPFA